MSIFRAAVAAAALCAWNPAPVHAALPLTLNDAFHRVIDTHPDLESYRLVELARRAEYARAHQGPSLRVIADAENLLGSGSASGLRGAELSLSLASVIERGGKRDGRLAVADAGVQGVDLLREGKRLDLLADVARRYLDGVAATAQAALAREDLARRTEMVAAISQRQRAGIEQSSAPLAAEAARLRVAAELARVEQAANHARRRLALLWGGTDIDFELSPAGLERLPDLPEYPALVRLLDETPELRRYAHEARLREARLQLARSAGVADIDWQLGVRRLQSGSDWGLVGSVSIPLDGARRAEPGVRAAEAELAAIEFERDGAQRALQATLAEAWSQLDLAIAHAHRLDTEVIPALQRAALAAARSYRAGASSHYEWAQLQGEIVDTHRERLAAALAAHRALIELQRLTGQSLQVATNAAEESTP